MIRPFACAVRRLLAVAGVVAMLAPGTAAALFVVNQPWVRPAAAGGSTESYMVLRSSEGTTLVGIRSELVSGITLEEPDSARRGKFLVVTRLPLPAGETVRLAPGLVHGHLASIKRSLKLGERVALVLTLEAADGTTQEIPVDAEVRHRSPAEDEMRAHGHPAPGATAH
jgi:periplasmic copper chaperone A